MKKHTSDHFIHGKKREFSKIIIVMETLVILFVTAGGFYIAYIAVKAMYMGALPWITALIAPAWGAYGVSVQQYYGKARAENIIKIQKDGNMRDC